MVKTIELTGLYIDRENHKRIWKDPVPEDYFAGKDWYADGKNIWIIQVGNKKDFESFENFKKRVSRARIEIDDAGDIECVYHIPHSDGTSQSLSLEYEDGGKFKVKGNRIEIQKIHGIHGSFLVQTTLEE